MPNVDINVNPGQTKTLTFLSADKYTPEDIVFEITAGTETPLVFKGTVGTGGTVTWTNLPAASSSNTGFMYKVVTAHATAPVCEVGDIIISNGSSWVVVPSGDETLATLSDTTISSPSDGQVLTYDNTSGKWKNVTPAAGSDEKLAVSLAPRGNDNFYTYYPIVTDGDDSSITSAKTRLYSDEVYYTTVGDTGHETILNIGSIQDGIIQLNNGAELRGGSSSYLEFPSNTSDTIAVLGDIPTVPTFSSLTLSGTAQAYDGTHTLKVQDGTTSQKGIVQLGTGSTNAAAGNHSHGNITNGGDITATGVSIENGDAIVIRDNSASKLAKTSITFDGSTTNQFLSKKGTWESASVSDSDEKLAVSQAVDGSNDGSVYFDLLITDDTDATKTSAKTRKYIDSLIVSLDKYESNSGTTLEIGKVNDRDGFIKLFGKLHSYNTVIIPDYFLSQNVELMLPSTSGTLALDTHTHGNIQSGGTLQTNDITIANGDKLVVTDSSDSNKVARTSVSFDGSTIGQYLSKKGTWENVIVEGTITYNNGTYSCDKTYAQLLAAYSAGQVVRVKYIYADEDNHTEIGLYYINTVENENQNPDLFFSIIEKVGNSVYNGSAPTTFSVTSSNQWDSYTKNPLTTANTDTISSSTGYTTVKYNTNDGKLYAAASPAATIGTLNTTNTTSQSTSSSESFGGSINLHKVSKTGLMSDLVDYYDFTMTVNFSTGTVSNASKTPAQVFTEIDSNSNHHFYCNLTDSDGYSYYAEVVRSDSGTPYIYIPVTHFVYSNGSITGSSVTYIYGGLSASTWSVTSNFQTLSLGTTHTTAAYGDHDHSGVYQPLDADLTSIAGLSGTSGILKKTAANTWTLDTTSYQPLDADLTAIAGLSGTTGLLKKTAADTWTLDTTSYGTYSKPNGGIPSSDLAESYKTVQTAVSDPTASTTFTDTVIDSISQNTNGVITATKKTIPLHIVHFGKTGNTYSCDETIASLMEYLMNGYEIRGQYVDQSVSPIEGYEYVCTYGKGNFQEGHFADNGNEVQFTCEYKSKTYVLTGVRTSGSDVWTMTEKTEIPTVTGNAGKVLTVNSGETGVEWTTPSGGSDEKLAVSAATFPGESSTLFDIIVTNDTDSTKTSAKTRKYTDSAKLQLSEGSGNYDATLVLGKANEVNGNICFYSQDHSYSSEIYVPYDLTEDVNYTLPSSSGTLALTSDIRLNYVTVDCLWEGLSATVGSDGDCGAIDAIVWALPNPTYLMWNLLMNRIDSYDGQYSYSQSSVTVTDGMVIYSQAEEAFYVYKQGLGLKSISEGVAIITDYDGYDSNGGWTAYVSKCNTNTSLTIDETPSYPNNYFTIAPCGTNNWGEWNNFIGSEHIITLFNTTNNDIDLTMDCVMSDSNYSYYSYQGDFDTTYIGMFTIESGKHVEISVNISNRDGYGCPSVIVKNMNFEQQ